VFVPLSLVSGSVGVSSGTGTAGVVASVSAEGACVTDSSAVTEPSVSSSVFPEPTQPDRSGPEVKRVRHRSRVIKRDFIVFSFAVVSGSIIAQYVLEVK
jgi:hypothetical protein